MELGIATFVDQTPDPATGVTVPDAERMRQLLDEVRLADRLGLDVFAVGEHHRPDYLASAPAVILGAAAAVTERIRLTSAVTVLSSDDPVRVYQQYATVDLLSGGRAEIMAGRGSFIESFPLFGQNLQDYDELFAEKLSLLLKLRDTAHVTWQGRHRPPLSGQGVYPRSVQTPLPVWIAVGGTPQSVARAGMLGLPLAMAIIGGEPARFVPLADLYREAGRRAGQDTARLKLALNLHGFVAETDQQAADTFFPPYRQQMSKIGRERGWSGLTRAQFDAGCAPEGHLMVGDPETVAAKILAHHRLFGHDRCLIQMTVGTVPQAALLRSIELFATEVAPRVRAGIAAEVLPAAAEVQPAAAGA